MMPLEQIDYSDRSIPLTGWLARPTGTARGAVLIFPTIININPAMERRAKMLAEAGFVAMIADFYGQPVPSFEAARPLADALRGDVDHYRTRLIAAMMALQTHEAANGLPMAAIGYCMGGQAALELARSGANLVLAASFHGLLDSTRRATEKTPIIPRILVCHGDADPMVPREAVMSFWEEMDVAGANWHFHSYSGVKHGFTDPASDARGLPAIAYDASADRQSWAALMDLCNECFAKQSASPGR